MVRGLVIRQLFLVLDLILIGLIVLTAAMVIMQLVNTPKIVNASPVDSGSIAGSSGDLVDELRERTAYNSIQENGLFGPAGRFSKPVAPPVVEEPVVVDESLEETKLNLKLWGVTSLSPRSPFASASIEDMSMKDGSKLFHVNESVVEGVTLEEIHARWVILLNTRETPARRERLSMDDEEDANMASNAAASSRSNRATVLPSERVELDKNAFVQELYVNYADLVTKVKPELYRDANGKVAGITAADISDVPLARQLGLENGDILQTVNNEQIDSEQKILEMVQKYQNSNAFRIGIMRNGKQKIITYNFR